MTENKLFNWIIFIILSIIWGSSFVLMKEGLVGLNALQVASFRIISSGLILLPVAVKSISTIPQNKFLIIFVSGILGSLLPAYLFCIAEQRIDSSLAGTLNALTPIFAIIIGILFFKTNTARNKKLGIGISFLGSILLFFAQPSFNEHSNITDVLLVIVATICYAVNVNLVGKYLKDISSLTIVSVALLSNAVPAAFVLYYTGYFEENIFSKVMLVSAGYTMVLGVVGTAVASVMFYTLIKRAGVVLSSMVTYAIPVVAVFWGIVYGEIIGWQQIVCLIIILGGVYVANKSGNKVAN